MWRQSFVWILAVAFMVPLISKGKIQKQHKRCLQNGKMICQFGKNQSENSLSRFYRPNAKKVDFDFTFKDLFGTSNGVLQDGFGVLQSPSSSEQEIIEKPFVPQYARRPQVGQKRRRVISSRLPSVNEKRELATDADPQKMPTKENFFSTKGMFPESEAWKP